jgi:hypothetical protein
VNGVTIDGQALSPSEGAIIGRDHLVRVDGGVWPSHNAVALPDTEPGTWSIDLTVGSEVPDLIRRATTDLVTELALSMQMDPACKLPASTTSVSRQGLSFSMENRVEQVRESGSLLPSIGMVVGTYNPMNQRLPSDVLNPDTGWILYRSSASPPKVPSLSAVANGLTVDLTTSGTDPSSPTNVDWADA